MEMHERDSFMDTVRRAVFGGKRPLKCIAADLEIGVSDLTRMVMDDATEGFPLQKFPDLIAATGDVGPILWLVDQFIKKDEQEQ